MWWELYVLILHWCFRFGTRHCGNLSVCYRNFHFCYLQLSIFSTVRGLTCSTRRHLASLLEVMKESDFIELSSHLCVHTFSRIWSMFNSVFCLVILFELQNGSLPWVTRIETSLSIRFLSKRWCIDEMTLIK